MDLKELLDLRGKATHDARAILDTAEAEKRDLTDDEQKQVDKFMDDSIDLKVKIDRETQLREAERQVAERAGQQQEEHGVIPAAGEQLPEAERAQKMAAEFRSYIQSGVYPPDGEFRALQADSDIAGGFLVMPEQFVAELIKDVDNQVFIRNLARVFPLTNADSLGAPSLDTDVEDATWSGEISTVNEDTALVFGKRDLKPQPLSKLVKVSMKLLRASAISAELIVRERLAYKMGVTQEKGFLTGTGANEPLGVFTASDDGVSTSRDVSTDNTTTAFTFDGLKNVKYSMKGQYWAGAQWVFHRDGVKMASKLKDGEGQYQWQESTIVGDPDRLLNFPVNMSEYAPNTFTTGLYVGILADFSQYWIAESLAMEIQRLNELYAATSQIGFISRGEVDGMPVNENGFARVKLA